MKALAPLAAAIALAAAAPPASADVAVSVSIGEPGFYGQLDIGGMPRPPVIFTQPMVVERAPEFRAVEPIYLHVPPGHEKHWRKHCQEYNACGRPVYFVRDDWYQDEYVPRYHRDHGLHHDHEHDHGRHRGEDRRDRD
ncbi:MAG: hypothetical protein JSR54_03465 [Proteobacteria bacterium]|nr:hypothetical protein [Pseudomonadota bacterium]